ncbi:unnamed protein product, partial [Pylaiella littoralis]
MNLCRKPPLAFAPIPSIHCTTRCNTNSCTSSITMNPAAVNRRQLFQDVRALPLSSTRAHARQDALDLDDRETDRQRSLRIGQQIDKIRQNDLEGFHGVEPCSPEMFSQFVASLRNVTNDVLTLSDSEREQSILSERWAPGWSHHLRKRVRNGIRNPTANADTPSLVDDVFQQAAQHSLKPGNFG